MAGCAADRAQPRARVRCGNGSGKGATGNGKQTSMKTTFLGAAVILAALGFAPPASAETFTFTFTGTVTYDSEYNMLGVSGGGANTFLGDTFTDTFQLNTANGGAYIDPGYTEEYYGGSFFGVSSPVSSTATFDGQSTSFTGSYSSYAYGGDSAAYPVEGAARRAG
jgi:hypothetical protein